MTTKGPDEPTTEKRLPTELAALGPRKDLPPGNAIQIRQTVNDLRVRLGKIREREGEDAHEVGTQVLRLYKAHADTIYSAASFLAFAQAELGLSESTVYRYARLARYANEKQATWGVEACLAAATIVDLLEQDPVLRRRYAITRAPKTITDIAGIALPLGGKRTLTLSKDTVTHAALEEALATLRGTNARRSGKGLPAALRSANERIGAAIARDPQLTGVEAGFTLRKGKPRLNISLPPGANLAAIARGLERALGET